MPDLDKVIQDKERIISLIKTAGPSFPGRVASQIGMSPLFVSALLAELLSEGRLKISSMKVGSSPIYYIPGTENSLENFSNHLNQKEKEAFSLLRKEQILEDDALDPAIRVALRSIPDFATAINVRVDGESKLFWKYLSLSEDSFRQKIQELLNPEKKAPIKEEVKEVPQNKVEETPKEILEVKEEIKEVPKIIESEKPKVEKTERKIEPILEKPVQKENKKSAKPVNSDFTNSIREILASKDIEILEEILEKKKEFVLKIRIDTLFGKQSYYLIAKEKKKVSEDDLAIALQKAQAEKMPALFMAPGDLDKKALSYLEHWSNIVKFEKVRI